MKSKTFHLYQSIEASEKYYCDFGPNSDYQKQLHDSGLRGVGTDNTDEARILELSNHTFYSDFVRASKFFNTTNTTSYNQWIY